MPMMLATRIAAHDVEYCERLTALKTTIPSASSDPPK
jgi:hypothetical protein